MCRERIEIAGIPAIIWGKPSDRVWLCVHGKMSSKDAFEYLAGVAEENGCQTVGFDLPQHGERTGDSRRCDIWNGIKDLDAVAEYVFSRWKQVSLYACSLGAFFSLHAYKERRFEKCLFQSPVIDMEFLIRRMMLWFGVSEERLKREKEVETPIDLLSWDYFQYVLAHPVEKWEVPTDILFGGRDDLQSLDIIKSFADRFDAGITFSENSEHPFMTEKDFPIVEKWLYGNIR